MSKPKTDINEEGKEVIWDSSLDKFVLWTVLET